jgi:putative DNA primase/helicase
MIMSSEIDAYDRLISDTRTYYKQDTKPNDRGKFGYVHIKQPITTKLLADSLLSHGLTIGACTIEAGTDLVKCASFDIDNHTGTENIIPEIQKLYDACIKAGLHPIIESSSGDNVNDGCHILFPCNPTKASIIRKMLKPVLDSTGFNHEVNPKQDHVEPDKFGNQVKLIWQYNNRTGKRSTIINPETMLAFERQDGINYIMSCPDNVFHEIPGREPPTPPITEAPEQSSVSIKSEMSFDEQFGLKNIKPCIVKAYNDKWMLHGKGDEGHNFRIAIAGNLFFNGATDQQAHDFFRIQDDYTERTTHLQLETIHKYLSSGRRPTGCKTIMEKCAGLLKGMCETCPKKPKEKSQKTLGAETLSDSNPVYTDMRNSTRLLAKTNELAKYNINSMAWMVYTGQKWETDARGVMMRYAREVARDVQRAALAMEDLDKRKDALKKALACESYSRLDSMVKLCQSELGVCIEVNNLDTNPMLFNVPNGTVNLVTGEIQAHSAIDLISNISPVRYDKTAKCPVFLKFIYSIMNGNVEMVNYIQKLTGYFLTGDTMEKGFYVFHGITDTGKSTFIELLLSIMGDYGASADTSLLLSNKFNSKSTNDLADLVGKRFVCASETEEGAALDEPRIKRLSGGVDDITCRQLYERNITYRPQYKAGLATNVRPYIRGSDDAIWSRMNCIPFNNQIPKEDQDKKLPGKMKLEYSGILNWMIEGCIKWQSEGLKAPEEISAHTKDYRYSMDTIKVFLDEYYVQEKGEHYIVPNKEMYQKYRLSQISNGINEFSIINIKTFIAKVGNSGVPHKKINRAEYWFNIREKTTTEERFDEETTQLRLSQEGKQDFMSDMSDMSQGSNSIEKNTIEKVTSLTHLTHKSDQPIVNLTPTDSGIAQLCKEPIVTIDRLTAFFDSYSRMANPETFIDMKWRSLTAVNQLKVQLRMPQERAERIWQDYCVKRSWPIGQVEA